MPTNDARDGREFLHGTSALAAACVAVEGFRLLTTEQRIWQDGCLGGGIYVTRALATAMAFAGAASGREGPDYVLRVRLAPGIRLLRLTGRYDARVIDALRREFGHEVLCVRFPQALPRNKHLRARELIELLNYLWSRRELLDSDTDSRHLRGVRRYLTRLRYDGFGCPDSDIGMVVFNPSALELVRIEACDPVRRTLSAATPQQLVTDACRELDLAFDVLADTADLFPDDDSASQRELLARYRERLASYGRRNGASMSEPRS